MSTTATNITVEIKSATWPRVESEPEIVVNNFAREHRERLTGKELRHCNGSGVISGTITLEPSATTDQINDAIERSFDDPREALADHMDCDRSDISQCDVSSDGYPSIRLVDGVLHFSQSVFVRVKARV